MAEASEGSGIIRSIQLAGLTYSSHFVGHDLKISDRTSYIQAPASSTPPLPLGWFSWLNSIDSLSHLQRCSITAAVGSPSAVCPHE